MTSLSRRKNVKIPRNSPKAPADFDSESEDQNRVHPLHSSSSSKFKIPPMSHKTPRSKSRHKESEVLWGLDAPGTDSGICSSDQTINWSSVQHPSKTKSTILVGQSTNVSSAVTGSKSHSNDFSNSIALILTYSTCLFLAFLSSGIVYYLICSKVDFLSNNISFLSDSIQILKEESTQFPPDSKINHSMDSHSTTDIKQEMSRIKTGASIMQNQQQQLFLEIEDTKRTLKELKDKMYIVNETIKGQLFPLHSRIDLLEEKIKDQKNLFLELEHSFQDYYNISLTDINTKLDLLSRRIYTLNSSRSDFNDTDSISNQLIESAFAKHYRDQIGLYDFALGSAGGRIVTDLTSETFFGPETLQAFGLTLFSLSNSAEIVLQPSVLPGNCWPFEGTKGLLGIRITHQILLLNITLDHVPKEISHDGCRSSAPKDFIIRGLIDPNKIGFILGRFSFAMDSPYPFQTFMIPNATQNNLYSLFQYEFLSNHGNRDFTCIYRLRLHGQVGSN